MLSLPESLLPRKRPLMYRNLKLQIWRLGTRQNRLAQMAGIHETLLSKIVNGFREPDAETRTRLAKLLKCDAEWLFAQEMSEVEIKQDQDSDEALGKAVDRSGR